jgi:3-methyladenine DNA glycosylase AlkD
MRDECKAYCASHALDHDALIAAVTALFATDGFDLRSVAIALLERNHALLVADDLPWLVELCRTGACWAHVDYLVTQAIEPVLLRQTSIAKHVRAWAKDKDFWIRRVALLSQLKALRTGGGDFALFVEIATPMLGETEFFIRKAIGWVLREVSKKRPALVEDFLRKHPDCAGVTWREAVKYLPSKRALEALRAR